MARESGTCRNCGARLARGAAVCGACGASVVSRQSRGDTGPIVLPEPASERQPAAPARPAEVPRQEPPRPEPAAAPPSPPAPGTDRAARRPAPPSGVAGRGTRIVATIGNVLFLALAWGLGWGSAYIVGLELGPELAGLSGARPVTGAGEAGFGRLVDLARAGAIGGAVAALALSGVFGGRSLAGSVSFVLAILVWGVIEGLRLRLGLPPDGIEAIGLHVVGGAALGAQATLAQLRGGSLRAILRLPLGLVAGALGGMSGALVLALL